MKSPAGWTNTLLHHVAEVRSGLSKSAKREGPMIRKPYLRVANVQDGFLDLSEIKEIDVPANQVERFTLKTGDLLLIEGNGNPENLGRGCLWEGQVPDCVHQNHVFAVRALPGTNLLPRFLALLLQSDYGRNYLLSCAKGSTGLSTINSVQLKQFPVLVPPIFEQNAITDAIASWETAIEKTERLIVLRASQKAWLLTQVISSSGQTTKLGHFLKQVSRPVPKPTEPYWALGIRSHGKGTFQRFVEDPSSVDMEELYALNRDNLIVNITFAWEGAIAFVKQEDERCLVSHRFPTYEVNREIADPDFVKYIVNCKAFFSQLALISPGGAGRNRVLNKKDFLKLEVSLPPLGEQKRLAQILRAMDLLIEKETSLLAVLKTQKRGLMQKLLTGQWRVPVEANEVAA